MFTGQCPVDINRHPLDEQFGKSWNSYGNSLKNLKFSKLNGFVTKSVCNFSVSLIKLKELFKY